MLIYGKPKIGKTSLLLRLVQPWEGVLVKDGGPIVFLISADKGTKQIQLDPQKYQGRIKIAYPDTLSDWRRTAAEVFERVSNARKIKAAKDIWVCIDTVGHMQNMLLAEARTIEARDARQKKGTKPEDAYLREMTTRVDYGINLCHMGELSNSFLRTPANIVMLAVEREKADANGRKEHSVSLSGQSHDKIIGDADVFARMVLDNDKRMFLLRAGSNYDAGDRTGRLDNKEPADLAHVYEKIFGNKQPVVNEGKVEL